MLKHTDNLLVIGEQASLRAAVARLVVPLGYGVELASSEKRARQLLGEVQFKAAVVEPTGVVPSGSPFLREVENAVAKLIVITDDATEAKRLAISFPDAMVCRSKPLEHDKLLAFLSGAARVASDSIGTPERLHFADRTLDVAGRIFLDAAGREVALTRSEFELLVALARNPGRALSRAQLRNAVDGGRLDAFDRSIDMLVARLRRKIEPATAKPQFIVTVPGIGYKLVARVCDGVPAADKPPAALHRVGGTRDALRAERRQLTVLSCQILGFSALATTLDPEDLQRAIGPVYATCADIVARFGGMMLRTLGDNVLACFGYPTPQADNAENAVRAALELSRAVRKSDAAPVGNFRARIGIATGPMIIGEWPSGGTQRQPTAIGGALSLALHLQKAAPPEGIAIASTTRDLIGRFFNCRAIEPVELEGQHEPVPAWQVVEEIESMVEPETPAWRRTGRLVDG